MRNVFFGLMILTFAQVFSQRQRMQINFSDTTISYPLFYKNTDSLSRNKLKAYYASDTNVLAYEKNYYYGNQNGIYKEFYPSGSTYLLCIYQQGKIHGDWAQYDEFGKVHLKAKYRNGVKHGFFIDKKKHFQGRYRNGKKHGKWEYNLNSLNYYKRYFDNGDLIGKRKLNLIPNKKRDKNDVETSIEPEVVQVWEEERIDTVVINYPNETQTFIVRYISRDSLNHPTMRKAIYQDSSRNTAIIKYIYGGKLSGNYKIYFPNGKLYKHLFYNYGLLNGAYKEYNSEEELICLGKYNAGKKHGKWKFNLGKKNYYIIVYKDGEQVKSTKPN